MHIYLGTCIHGTAPTVPLVEDLIPVYSYDLKELQSVEILLAVSYPV